MNEPPVANDDLTTLIIGARELGIELSPGQLHRFATFQRELIEWNARFNLTAITTPVEIQIKHFLDSLTVLAALPGPLRDGSAPGTALDVGAGAGLPGIPLAIVLPRLRVTLLEATQKKCRFLEHALSALGLESARVLCGRAEDLGHLAEERGTYDIVVARAVASLATLVELCLPFARLGGRMIAPKKLGIDAELGSARRAIKLLGGELAAPVIVRLPILNETRQLIVVDKLRPTPPTYPRRPGIPAKAPL